MSDRFNEVYSILVGLAGAREDERAAFLANMQGENPAQEWRFCGRLGFGGKFWRERAAVTCYPEDSTPERERILADTNRALQAL